MNPHIILICIDALRADCLREPGTDSIWAGTGRPATPALDRLASSSRVFSNVQAASSWTKPSMPSVFLSLHPSEHGVLEVAKGAHGAALSTSLPGSVATLPELLAAGGYRTIGLAHNAQLDPALGFSRGFDVFSSDAGDGDAILERVQTLDPFGGDAPGFLYLHFIEPHWPYGKRIARRANREACGRFPFHRFKASQWKALKLDLKRGHVSLTDDEVRFLRWVYRLAVEEADRAVGRFLEWLDSSGALERSVVLVTADHGEELLDHGLVGHGQSLHEELVRVPLLLRIGRDTGLPRPVDRDTCDDPVGHVDVLPTLAEAAGVTFSSSVSGRSLLNGAGAEHVFSEVKHKRRYHQAVRDRRYKLIRSYFFRRAKESDAAEDYNNLDALFADRPFRQERRLYDLRRDPAETENLAAVRPDVADRLESVLEEWWRGLKRHRTDSLDLEAVMIRRLEALGYL